MEMRGIKKQSKNKGSSPISNFGKSEDGAAQ